MSSAVFVAALVVLAWSTRWRIPVALVCALALVAVGLSRLVLGAHYPSDVLGWLGFRLRLGCGAAPRRECRCATGTEQKAVALALCLGELRAAGAERTEE